MHEFQRRLNSITGIAEGGIFDQHGNEIVGMNDILPMLAENIINTYTARLALYANSGVEAPGPESTIEMLDKLMEVMGYVFDEEREEYVQSED